MEISSVASSDNLSSTLTKALDNGQKMDAFSELLAILFGNMFISNTNQYNSLMMNPDSLTDSNNTSVNSIELNQMLSIIDNLRINGGQLKDTENIQSLINNNSLLSSVLGNNTDFQKLFNLPDNVPDELQEFINNINGLSSKGSENISPGLSNDIVNIISEQFGKDVNTSELLNIQVEENATASEPKKASDTLNAQVFENSTVSDLKKALDKINIHTTAIEAEKSSENTVNDVNIIKSITETNENSIDNSANTQGEAKDIKPEEKTSRPFELTNIFEQATRLNNTKNENADNLTMQQKVTDSSLIEKPQDLIDFTVEKFKTLRLPGSTEVTVKLKPEELGEVSLKLVLEKGQINGSITADRKEVVVMLQNNLEQLKTDLKNSNVNLNNLSVNIQSGEDFDRNNSRRGFNNKQNRNNHRIVQAFEEEIQPYDLTEGFNIIA